MRSIYRALMPQLLVCAVAALLLSGCATNPGTGPPVSFNQRAGNGYLIVSAIRDTALRLLEGGKITDVDAEEAQGQANTLRTMLDAAREIHAVSEAGGESKLETTLLFAEAVTDCLAERERGPPDGAADATPSLAACIQQRSSTS